MRVIKKHKHIHVTSQAPSQWAYDKTKTWIVPRIAFEIFGWTLLDGFDVFNLCLHGLPAKAA